MVDVLPDDHVETGVLRNFAFDASCAVIGAYKGATMAYLLEHKARTVHGVEPQEWARDAAVKMLLERGPASWEIDCVALVPWVTNMYSRVRLFSPGNDGASIVNRPTTDSQLVTAMNVIDWLGDHEYDFMVVNIEGSEYQVLPWLAMRTQTLLVQYHGPPMPFNQLERICEFNAEQNIGKGWVLYT